MKTLFSLFQLSPWLLSFFILSSCQKQNEGEGETASTPSKPEAPQVKELEFDSLTAALEETLGKPFQTTQMAGMDSAIYEYDGSIDDILKVIDPFIQKAGFVEDHEFQEAMTQAMGPNELELQKNMGIDMNITEEMYYKNESRGQLSITRMNFSMDDVDMKMLTIQLMDMAKMSELGKELGQPN